MTRRAAGRGDEGADRVLRSTILDVQRLESFLDLHSVD